MRCCIVVDDEDDGDDMLMVVVASRVKEDGDSDMCGSCSDDDHGGTGEG